MTEDESVDRPYLQFATGDCAVCGKETSSPLISRAAKGEETKHEEPFVCNRCLVEIRKEVYTELELRNRMARLETEVQSLGTKVWVLSTLFALFGIVIGFVLGAAFG